MRGTHKKTLTLLTFMIGALSVAASIVKRYIYLNIIASLVLYTEDTIRESETSAELGLANIKYLGSHV